MDVHPPYRASGDGALAGIERDVRGLILDLATARADLADHQTERARGTEELLVSLVGVMDAFERVFADVTGREEELGSVARRWIGNFRTVHRLLANALREQGVTPIETPTRRFDPAWHQALEVVRSDELAEGTIVREVARGYAWGDRVLRKTGAVVVGPAEPTVGGGPAGEAPWGG